MTLAKNELCDVRSVSGIIQYAKHTVVSNGRMLLKIIPHAKLSGLWSGLIIFQSLLGVHTRDF